MLFINSREVINFIRRNNQLDILFFVTFKKNYSISICGIMSCTFVYVHIVYTFIGIYSLTLTLIYSIFYTTLQFTLTTHKIVRRQNAETTREISCQ